MDSLITIKTKGDLYSLRKAAIDQLVYCIKDNVYYHLRDKSRFNKSDGWEIVGAVATTIRVGGISGGGGTIDDTLYVKYQAQYIGDPTLAPIQNIYGNIFIHGSIQATGEVTAHSNGISGSFWDDMPLATITTVGGIQLTGSIPPERFLREDGTWQLVPGSGGTTVHSYLTGLDYASAGHTGFAPTSHNHSWSQITSGVPTTFAPIAHQLDSATYHTVSGLTSGHFLKANSSTTFGFSALTNSEILPLLNDWFELVGTAPNQYIICKYAFASNYDIQAFTNSTWLPTTYTDHDQLNNLSYAASGHTGFEASLGNPTVDNYILSSTILGVRTWVLMSGGGVTPTDNILDWDAGNSWYAPYAVKAAGKFDSGTVAPTNSNRLNYDGYFYATKIFSGNNQVVRSATGAFLEINIIDGDISIAPWTTKDIGRLDTGTVDPTNSIRLNYDGYFYTTKLNSTELFASDGSLKHLTVKAGNASGASGTDAGNLYLRAGNAIWGDTLSSYGILHLIPGNGPDANTVPAIYIGDDNTTCTIRSMQLRGVETNIGLQITPKGTGYIWLGNNNQFLMYRTSINLGVDLNFNNIAGNYNIRGCYGNSGNPTGYNLTIYGGAAYNPGNYNGGNLILLGGLKNGTGIDGSVLLGGTTNAIKIDEGGEMSFIGTATVWDDIRIIPSIWDVAGGTDPDIINYQPTGTGGTFKVYAFAKGDEGWFTMQLPHGYKVGSDLKAHVHWSPGSRGNEENGNIVQWRLEYSISAINGTFPVAQTIAIPGTCDGTDDKHQITTGVTISGTGLGISSQLFGRIYRWNNVSDTWAGTGSNLPLFIELDFHYEIDTVGSKAETSK